MLLVDFVAFTPLHISDNRWNLDLTCLAHNAPNVISYYECLFPSIQCQIPRWCQNVLDRFIINDPGPLVLFLTATTLKRYKIFHTVQYTLKEFMLFSTWCILVNHIILCFGCRFLLELLRVMFRRMLIVDISISLFQYFWIICLHIGG